jgi:hypothetical protein
MIKCWTQKDEDRMPNELPEGELSERTLKRRRNRQARLAELAVALGKAYHRSVATLYVSLHGSVQPGNGGQEEIDWNHTSRNPHTGNKVPRKWKNAGAKIESGRLVLGNHRGKVVYRDKLRLLRAADIKAILSTPTAERWEYYLSLDTPAEHKMRRDAIRLLDKMADRRRRLGTQGAMIWMPR